MQHGFRRSVSYNHCCCCCWIGRRVTSLILLALVLLSGETTTTRRTTTSAFALFDDTSSTSSAAQRTTTSTTSSPQHKSLKKSSSSSSLNMASTTTTTSKQSRSIPKVETNVIKLREKYPTADGRGIKIAVLDTGCDLAAAGLQLTSEGKPKYLDFLDCTGDGDINTSTIKEVQIKEGGKPTIVGLSGRTLILDNDWLSPTSTEATSPTKVRVGLVRLYDLIPRSVMRRLKRERKEAYKLKQLNLIGQTQNELDQLQHDIQQEQAGNGGNGNEDDKKKDGSDDKDTEKKDDNKDAKKIQLIKQRKDKEKLLEHYQTLLDNQLKGDGDDDDAGPVMDVILFQDSNGSYNKVIIDIDGNGGDLSSSSSSAKVMQPFHVNRDIATLGYNSQVTFCIQIYDNGKTVSIVTDAGSHGTHVAGIAAAYFNEEDNKGGADATTTASSFDKNGVAPGAQILACKIGDGRLGSTETGTGLIRALIAAKKYGCHLINLSYGEPAWEFNKGRVSQVFTDATYKWGMTVFTSAGNDGPALSSLGSPGSLTSPITVGAYVSKDMMIDQYSTLPLPDGNNDGDEDDVCQLQDASYYFSSRGPTPDGAFPDICAPGGAIAPIPRHALQGKAQYHGTSMSSPNACGVAACILSAVLQQQPSIGSTVSPAELRRAIKNTASTVKPLFDPFAQGSGLISATSAVEYILKHHGKPGQAMTFDVSIPSRNNARGIYIRDAMEGKIQGSPMTFTVKVLPKFNHALIRTNDEMDELLTMELDLNLVPSESWVTCPERISLLSAQERNGQTFAVRLSTDDLPPGVHFATVDAVDVTDPSRGPLFQLPITVIVPHTSSVNPMNRHAVLNKNEDITLQDNDIDVVMSYKLEPGAPNRRFLEVPNQAEWATIKIKSSSPVPSETSPHRVLLHAIPFVRGDLPNTEIQLKKLIAVTEGVEKEFSLKVKGGSTMEVCLQLLWLANPAPVSVVATVEFHSLTARAPTLVASQPLVISSAREFARFGASASLRSETLNPKASLDTVQRTVRPKSYDIVSGSKDRDIMPPSDAELNADPNLSSVDGTGILDMFLKYEFAIEADGAIKAVPSIPSLFNQLYDSPLDSQIWELKDSNMQVLGSGSSMHHESPIPLKKGNYTMTFHTRHPDRKILEEVKDIPLQLSISTDKLDCKIYSEISKASTPNVTSDGRQELTSKVLRKGSFQDIYVARPTAALPSWVAPGDVMTGTVVLDNGNAGVTSMGLIYPVPPKSQVKKLNENKLPESKDDEEETLEDMIFDSKVAYLAKMRGKNNTDDAVYKKLSDELLAENPKSIPLLSELLAHAKGTKLDTDSSRAKVDAIRGVRKLLSDTVDEVALAQYFGLNPPSEDELAEDKEAAKLKKTMEEQKKLLQSCLLSLADALASLSIADSSGGFDELDESIKELKKWASGHDAFSEVDDKLRFTLTLSRHQRLCKGEIGGSISTLVDAPKNLKLGADKTKGLLEELQSVYKSLNGTEHITEDLQNKLHKRFPPKST